MKQKDATLLTRTEQKYSAEYSFSLEMQTPRLIAFESFVPQKEGKILFLTCVTH